MRAAEVACRPKRPLGRAHGDHLRLAAVHNRPSAQKRRQRRASSMRSLQRHNQRPQPNAVTAFHKHINEIAPLWSADRSPERVGLPLLP
jgi:hypothetical protein